MRGDAVMELEPLPNLRSRWQARLAPGAGYGDGVGLHLSQIAEADELLINDPLALLIGMVLDQQIGQTRNR